RERELTARVDPQHADAGERAHDAAEVRRMGTRLLREVLASLRPARLAEELVLLVLEPLAELSVARASHDLTERREQHGILTGRVGRYMRPKFRSTCESSGAAAEPHPPPRRLA